MSDDADLAGERHETELARAIEARRLEGAKKPPVLVSTGECLNECGEKCMPNSHFCSADCTADFDSRSRTVKRQHG